MSASASGQYRTFLPPRLQASRARGGGGGGEEGVGETEAVSLGSLSRLGLEMAGEQRTEVMGRQPGQARQAGHWEGRALKGLCSGH